MLLEPSILKFNSAISNNSGSFSKYHTSLATCEKKYGNHRVVVKIDSLQSCVVVNVPLSYLRKIENKILV